MIPNSIYHHLPYYVFYLFIYVSTLVCMLQWVRVFVSPNSLINKNIKGNL